MAGGRWQEAGMCLCLFPAPFLSPSASQPRRLPVAHKSEQRREGSWGGGGKDRSCAFQSNKFNPASCSLGGWRRGRRGLAP